MDDNVTFTEAELLCFEKESIEYQITKAQLLTRCGITISPAARSVYEVLLSFLKVNDRGKIIESIIYPSFKTLQNYCGAGSSKFIQDQLEELEEIPLIKVIRDRDDSKKGGKRNHNSYQILEIPEYIKIMARYVTSAIEPDKKMQVLFLEKLKRKGLLDKAKNEAKPMLFLHTTPSIDLTEKGDPRASYLRKYTKGFIKEFMLTDDDTDMIQNLGILNHLHQLMTLSKAEIKKKEIATIKSRQKDSYIKLLIGYLKVYKTVPSEVEISLLDDLNAISGNSPEVINMTMENLKKKGISLEIEAMKEEIIKVKEFKQKLGNAKRNKQAVQTEIKRPDSYTDDKSAFKRNRRIN
jgi:hypothetical protein